MFIHQNPAALEIFFYQTAIDMGIDVVDVEPTPCRTFASLKVTALQHS